MRPSTGLAQASITAQNVAGPTGNGVTANSTVASNVGGSYSATAIQVTGTYTTDLTVQITVDGTTWVSLSAATAITNAATGVQTAVIPSAANGVYRVPSGAVTGIRVTALGIFTGTAVVSILSDD